MAIWTLLRPERSKTIVMAIKDKKKNPLLVADLILRQTSAGPRPHRFRVTRDKKEEYRPPEELIDLLRLSERIMIASGGYPEKDKQILEMLEGYHLNADNVNICRFCFLKKQFNFITKKAIKYHKEFICEECAGEELLGALRNSQCHFGDEALKRIQELLLHTKDLDRTIGSLNPEEIDSEYTRFDTITSTIDVKKTPIKELPLNKRFKSNLLKRSENLLPVQALSIESGLLKRQNQLVTSATATGKTLIGEIAGIQNILNKKGKMLFLVPLVALANQKFDQFTKRYAGMGIGTSIRVGTSRIMTGKKDPTCRRTDTDIIVATYEGLDYILRSGGADLLGQVGTVVIDEVHMLEDDDRGHRLDGLIGRLRYIASGAQFIYLSATVAKPQELADKLGVSLIEYEHRPVPIERHLIFCPENNKVRLMAKLAREEYNKVSSKDHRGQSIIFTNSRRNCHRISQALPIRAAAYHAGLSSNERKKIERRFEKGELPVVVTTAALAAGVDFPASQVIFESLAMGIEWLTMQEFLQMLGRAGRPDYHDRGVVYLLATPEKQYGGGQNISEEDVALNLLKGQMEHKAISYGEEAQMEEILASAAVTSSKRDLKAIHDKMLADYNFISLLGQLKKKKFIVENRNDIALTKFGKIAAQHFLSVSKAFLILDAVKKERDPLEIITNLNFFDSVYFKYSIQISNALKVNMPSRVFQGAALDIVLEGENISRLDHQIQDQLFNFASDFLTCKCKESPYCGCAEHLFSRKVIKLRTEGMEPVQMVSYLENQYGITAYPGDVLGYLDDAIRDLDAVEMIAKAQSKPRIAKASYKLKRKITG